MSEYCEYMWDPSRGHSTSSLARSLYEGKGHFDPRDKKLAIKTVRLILRETPGIDPKLCTDEYITRFLLARKYRTEQAAELIVAYQTQITHRPDIFGNLTARDPPLQRALRAGIPGVLPARDRKGRCVLVILASQWDPIAVPALSVQRAIFLVLETLIQDPRNQICGFVTVVDWSGFSLRQGGALGAGALRNLISALRGRFPARFKAVHFLSPPLYVQATLALVKPFLDEKTRRKIYLHGNNLSTLHEHLPTDILPAELGGTGPAFNPGLWAEPVIHSAMKEAEIAAMKRNKQVDNVENPTDETKAKDTENHENQEIPTSRQRTRAANGKNETNESNMNRSENLESTNESHSRLMEEDENNASTTSVNVHSEPTDGNDSLETHSSLLIIKQREEKVEDKTETTQDTTDLFEGIGASKNSYTVSQEANESSKANNNKRNKRRGADIESFETTTTTTDNREADDRTRFRVYRDIEDNNETEIDSLDNIVNSDSPSDNSNNEFANQREGEDNRDSSLMTMRTEKIILKNGRNGSLPEEANLIT